jgi:A/G-specific adenine glycosylase
VLWLEDATGRILMHRRPPTGVWASLWSLPQFDEEDAGLSWFASHVTRDVRAGERLPPLAHAFSHYKLELQPLRWRGVVLRDRVGDNPDLRWVDREQRDALGIPAPIRRLLQAGT